MHIWGYRAWHQQYMVFFNTWSLHGKDRPQGKSFIKLNFELMVRHYIVLVTPSCSASKAVLLCAYQMQNRQILRALHDSRTL